MTTASLRLPQCIVDLTAKLLCGRRLCILTYHRVLAGSDPLRPSEPSAEQFESQLVVLRKAFDILRLDVAVELLLEGRLPRRALAITFDDGYLDNHDIALPILRRQGVPATFFIATTFLDGSEMFNDVVIEAVRHAKASELKPAWMPDGKRLPIASVAEKLAAINEILPILKKMPLAMRNSCIQDLIAELRAPSIDRQMMVPSEVLALHNAGMEVGGHTVNHPILCSLDDAAARAEMQQCKGRLEAILQSPVNGFAYPNGRPGIDYDRRHTVLAEELGYRYAVSTRWASAANDASRFELPRVAPWGKTAQLFALRVARAYRD